MYDEELGRYDDQPENEALAGICEMYNPVEIKGKFGSVRVNIESNGDWVAVDEYLNDDDIIMDNIFVDAAAFGAVETKLVSLRQFIDDAVETIFSGYEQQANEEDYDRSY